MNTDDFHTNYAEEFGGIISNPTPNPSADEEVETPRTTEAVLKHPGGYVGYCPVSFARQLERELTQLRQQHNAEREEMLVNKQAAEQTYCDRLEQLRSSLAEKEATLAGSDQLIAQCRELLELENGQSLTDRLVALQSELATAQSKLNELVMAVGTKFPGESRFETALRYITERESEKSEPSQTSTEKH